MLSTDDCRIISHRGLPAMADAIKYDVVEHPFGAVNTIKAMTYLCNLMRAWWLTSIKGNTLLCMNIRLIRSPSRVWVHVI